MTQTKAKNKKRNIQYGSKHLLYFPTPLYERVKRYAELQHPHSDRTLSLTIRELVSEGLDRAEFEADGNHTKP